MNIFEKIQAVMKEVQYLTKDGKVEFGSTKYKALSEEKVTTIMRQKLIEHGLVVYPAYQTSNRQGQITHVDVTYRMVNVDNPEEYIEIASCGDGADSQDKGSGKAMTYAFKYMWLRTFALPTGEDPDKISSEELDAMEASKEDAVAPICEECGKPIVTIKKKDGSPWLAEDIAAYTKARYKAQLCADCATKAKKEGR